MGESHFTEFELGEQGRGLTRLVRLLVEQLGPLGQIGCEIVAVKVGHLDFQCQDNR